MELMIIDPLAGQFKTKLEANFSNLTIYAVNQQDKISKDIDKIDILLTTGPPTLLISDEIMRKAQRLQWAQSIFSGVEFLTNLPSLKKEVIVTSTRGVHGPQVSEIVFYFMLALNRNFPQVVRNQDQKIWERWQANRTDNRIQARLLYGKKVGILGMGVIGEELARKCKAFGMTTYGIARSRKLAQATDHFYEADKLQEILEQFDYFISILPSTPENHKIIGAKDFSNMKSTAFFINVGRGDTVDEEALIDALKKGKIAGAGLDCFYTEPLPTGNPLWEMKNVVITPHIGGQSDIYVEQVLSIFEENLRRFLSGERRDLINLIDR
jgi:D-2-hydroxyacid dehydrogenase (NADP+)